jgi:hypothetical protein
MRETVTVLADETIRVEWLAASVVQAAPVQQPPRQTPRQQPVAPRLGVLVIQSIPAATLLIDGQPIRDIRQYTDSLTPGPHLVQLRKDGYITKDTTVTVIAGQQVRIRLRLDRQN